MTPQDRLASFWASECGARGPALIHTHGDCMDPERRDHSMCPCVDCGLTPERWVSLIHPNIVKLVPPEADIAMREAGLPGDPDDQPLELPQPGELGVPIMERHMATGKLRQWSERVLGYVDGDPRGPGRGLLSPEWVEWALHYGWKT